MSKIDFKKTDKLLYTGKQGRWDLVDVPSLPYLAISGQGDPNGPVYAAALSALYPVAYAVKFAAKAEGRDYVVPPLEALWWSDDPEAFVDNDRSKWQWQAILRLPDSVTDPDVASALENTRKKLSKKSTELPPLDQVSRVELSEGPSLQTLHIGPYTDEAPTLARLHDELMPEQGLTFNGPHHEIYLSDPRRVAPEKLRTILRQPVRKTG